MSNRRWLIAALILLAVVLLALLLWWTYRPGPPAPVPPTVTPTSTPVRITPTVTATAVNPATATRTPVAPTVLPPTATNTPAAEFTATGTPTPATPIATVALLGTHVVRRGETMYGIALQWEPRRFFRWGDDVWRPVCRVNPQILDCRVIYPGDVLRIPRR